MLRLTYKWRVYLHGLVAAVINAISNSAVVVMVDPAQFNLFQGGARKLSMVAGASAVFAFFTFLKDHPLPDPDKDADFAAAQTKAVEKVMVQGTGDDAIAEASGTGTGTGSGK